MKYDILKSINNNTITLLVAGTGFGKTTQLVQYCYSLQNLLKYRFDRSNIFPILSTQPRKFSCVSIARRVAEEMSFELDKDIKTIQFSLNPNQVKESSIVYLSENTLLNYLIKDVYLKGFYFLILDEAHERSMNLDIILFLLKSYTLKSRKDFRLIITSATINYKQLESYFSEFEPKVLNCLDENKKINIEYESANITEETYLINTVNVLSEKLQGILKAIVINWFKDKSTENLCNKDSSTKIREDKKDDTKKEKWKKKTKLTATLKV